MAGTMTKHASARASASGHRSLEAWMAMPASPRTPSPSSPPATAAADERVLTALIERQLVLAEVERYVVDDPTAAEVTARFGEVVERVGGTSFFESLLPLVGLERSDVLQIVRDDLRIELYLAGRFPSSDVRSDLVNEWIASLIARADVLRVDP